MKNYNKLPFKERKRHYDYQYNQTYRQEEILLERERKKLMQEKADALCREERFKTEKERETEEIYKKLEMLCQKGGEG